MKQVTLSKDARVVMDREARAGYPAEICGVLVGRTEDARAVVTRAVPLPNEADAALRRRRFTLDPAAVLGIERELRGGPERVLGFYHTHPDVDAVPSSTDMQFFRLWPETVWIITAVRGGTPDSPRAWWLADAEGRAEELPVS